MDTLETELPSQRLFYNVEIKGKIAAKEEIEL